jgi:hypothetical protein
MSYDIYFIKTKNLCNENLEDYLVGDVSTNDEHYISLELINELKEKITNLDFKFEVNMNNEEGFLEFSFTNFQVSLISSQAVISVPYWIESLDESTTNEIESILHTFIDSGFTGYDQQTDRIFSDGYKFFDSFLENQTAIKDSLDEFKKNKDNSWILYLIGFIIIILIFVIWELIF